MDRTATSQVPDGEARWQTGLLVSQCLFFHLLYYQNLNLVEGGKCVCAKYFTPQVTIEMVESQDTLVASKV